MTVIRCKVIIKSRTIDMRRAGIKVRTYENVRVFLQGTAGGKTHWAEKEFKDCLNSSAELTYFSGNKNSPYIAIHGDHVHIMFRDKDGSLVQPDENTAEKIFKKFLEYLKSKGVEFECTR